LEGGQDIARADSSAEYQQAGGVGLVDSRYGLATVSFGFVFASIVDRSGRNTRRSVASLLFESEI